MTIFNISDEIELGNATWSAVPGDTINLNAGKYGLLPIKPDVDYKFLNDASAAQLLGLGIVMNGAWSAGTVTFGDTSIINPKIDPNLINCTYLFIKRLSVNSRFPPETSFVHPNGSIVMVLRNDRENFQMGGPGGAAGATPKAIVQIMIPVLQEFDVSQSSHSGIVIKGGDRLQEELSSAEPHINARKQAEQLENNAKIGLALSEMRYRALWALNDFIREYSQATGGHSNDKPFSVLSFSDDLETAIADSNGNIYEELHQSKFGHFSNAPLEDETISDIQTKMLSSRSSNLSDLVNNRLALLDYHSAILGMYQEFEILWESYDPSKGNKWSFIETHTTDRDEKDALAEMVNARNWVAHTGHLKTEHKASGMRNVLKTDAGWAAKPMSEYEIFAHKKPWVWRSKLTSFKNRNGW